MITKKKMSVDGQLAIAIATPTYNEAKNIANLLSSIDESVGKIKKTVFTVFVVDDSSPDGTAKIAQAQAKKIKSKNLSVEVLIKKKKEGLGKAYVWAFHQIIGTGKFDYIMSMDADLSHDPKYLAEFAKLAHADKDMVVASRYVKGGDTPDWSLKRKLLSRFGNYYIRLFLGSRLTDWTGGYNMYKTTLLARLDLDSLPGGYAFLLTLKNMALKLTDSAVQFPIIFPDRTEGESKIPKDTMRKTLVLVPKLSWKNNMTKPKLRRAGIVAGAIAGFGALTALVFLYMAGNTNLLNNWPINFELQYMDNSFLWNFSRDLVHGHRILFQTSGQSFLFPEIPISILAYVLAHGSIYWYYLIVAVLNNVILLGLIMTITFLLFKEDTFRQKLLRSLLAAIPLVLTLFVTQSNLYWFNVAPTYNFDVYVAILTFPIFFLAKTRRVRWVITAVYLLCAMSNMLSIVFTLPIILAMAAIVYMRKGIIPAIRLAVPYSVLSMAAIILNKLLFHLDHSNLKVSIKAASTSGYIGFSLISTHMGSFVQNIKTIQNGDWAIGISFVAIIATIVCALFYSRRYFNEQLDKKNLGKLYLALFPVTGALVSYIITIFYHYYAWPLMVGSIIVALWLLVPKRYIGLLLGLLLLFAGVKVLHHADRIGSSRHVYVGWQDGQTACMDKYLPQNSYTMTNNNGFGLVSTSVSHKNITILRVAINNLPNIVGIGWLNNLDQPEAAGQVHYFLLQNSVSTESDQKVMQQYRDQLSSVYGDPTAKINCGENQNKELLEIWYYKDKNLVPANTVTR